MWDAAISELEASFVLKQNLLPANDRQLATLHYQIATVASAQMEKARREALQPPTLSLPGAPPMPEPEECAMLVRKYQAKAIGQFSLAAEVLEAHLKSVRAAAPEKVDEVAELLTEVRAKVEEVQLLPTLEVNPDAANTGASSSNDKLDDDGSVAISVVNGNGKRAMGDEAPHNSAPMMIGSKSHGPGAAVLSGFAAPSSSAPVKDLGIVGNGKKRIRLD